MNRTIFITGLAALLAVSFAACKKKTEKPATGETAAGGDIAKFDDGYAAFREAIRFVSLTPDKEKAAEAAGRAEECFGEVAKGWPTQPPEQFEGDNDWANRITSLTKIMGDIKNLVGADNYNRLGYAEGRGLLGVTVGRPTARAEAPEGQVGIEFADLTHPITREFESHPDSGLFRSRIDQYLAVEVDPDRGDVILRYTSGEPALIESRFGQGRVIFCTTTAGMDWNNLPGKGDFVSLMFNTVAFLSPRHGNHRNVMVGERVAEPLTPAESSFPIRITTSEGATVGGRIVPVDEVLTAEYGPVERAGVVTISIGPEARKFAANVDPRESDLAAVEGQALTAALDRPVHFIDDVAGVADEPVAVRSSELASMALYSVIVLLFAEMWLAMWFGSHRRGG